MNDQQPFCPSRCPIYYGWVVLLCSSLGVLMSIPGQTIGVSVFTDSLMEVLGLSRIQLSTAYMLGTIGSSLFLARAGRLYDRIGARRMAAWVGCLLGLTLAALSWIDYLVSFVDGLVPMAGAAAIGFIAIMLGFFGLRFFGQGALTMASKNMAMKWFEERRGVANAVIAVMVSFGFSTSVFLLDFLVQEYTWRGAWKILALVVGVAFPFLAILFFRDNPQASGLSPDGKKVSRSVESSLEVVSFTLQEAKSTYLFWAFNIGLALIAMIHTAICFHVVSIFEEAGLSRGEGIAIFLPVACISTAVTIVGGWASDRIELKYILMLMAVGLLLCTGGLLVLEQEAGSAVLILGMGIGQGAFAILASVTWPTYFGTNHLGAISGYSMSWIVFFSAIGPAFYGASLDLYGSYNLAGIVSLVLSGVLLLGAARVDFTPAVPALSQYRN